MTLVRRDLLDTIEGNQILGKFIENGFYSPIESLEEILGDS